MYSEKKLVVSHAPFWHDGGSVSARHYNIMLAALIPVIAGCVTYGVPAIGVVALSISCAILWELLMNKVMRRPVSIGDGNAALIGLLLAMLMPATMPWWAVLIGTFVAIVIAKQIFGGLGANPFNPVLISVAILMASWPQFFDFNYMLANYDTGFAMAYPLGSAKYFGASSVAAFTPAALLMGKQSGGIGTTFGLGVIIGGVYYFLVTRGITYIWHWENIPRMFFYYGTRFSYETTPSLHMGVLMIGFVLTLKISVVAIIFAILLGTILGICRLSSEPVTKAIAFTFVELIRNTPLLVQIYIIYFFAGSMLRLSAWGLVPLAAK